MAPSVTVRSVAAILLLWGAGLVAAAQFAKIAVPFAEVGALYPGAADEAGWLLSLVSLVGAALGVVAGGLASRVGPAILLLAGLSVGAALSAWQATGPSFAAMLAGRVVEGISHLAIVVAAPVLIARVAPTSLLGAAMALWSTFFGVAFALTAWLGLPLVAVRGPDALFAAHAGAALIVALALVPVLRICGALGPLLVGTAREARRRGGLLALHSRAYRSPRIAAPGLGWLFYTLTFVALLAILPGRLADEVRPTVTALMPLASIAASLFAVPLLLRVTRATTIVVLGFALAVSILLGAMLGLPLAPAAVALFAMLGLVQGASFVAVAESNADAADRALGYGVMAQTGNIGNLTGTPLLLAILAYGGDAIMLASVGGLYLAAITVHLVLQRKARQPRYPLDERRR
jgi:MFS family permease